MGDLGKIGTGLHVEASVRLPLLGQEKDFKAMCRDLGLQAKRTTDMDEEGIYDVSNVDRLGSSEVEQVNVVARGVRQLLAAEQELFQKSGAKEKKEKKKEKADKED